MNSLDVIDIKTGKKIDEVQIPENIVKYINYKKPQYVLHEYVTAYLANQRQGTHSTKTRSEVRGGGRKPWVQKHTGRARQGSIRSPLWRKGGVVFGPKPRDYYISLPKKKKRLAKYLALVEKLKNSDLIVVQELTVESNKTKSFVKILKNLQLNSDKVLFVDKNFSENIKLASRNLKNVSLARINDLNAYIVLQHRKLVLSREALLCL
ncbi:MAG: 50S ribosomal protein L4 [Endomicrobia bacterium]|nr:50S ribosomal protein L4 [Endomicrobiia bacterium]MDW8055505.1 50S ribosomal protein L4 [Elusimicrobiota bacterium]